MYANSISFGLCGLRDLGLDSLISGFVADGDALKFEVGSEEEWAGADEGAGRHGPREVLAVDLVEGSPEGDVRGEDLQEDEVFEAQVGAGEELLEVLHEEVSLFGDGVGDFGGIGFEADSAGEVEGGVVDEDSVAEGTRRVFLDVAPAHGWVVLWVVLP